MILTCPQCQNTYQIDDQLYAQQGGALCAQCQIPLMPADNGGYAQQWQQGADQWGQQQWDPQQQQQWDQQQQWGQQQQWDQQQQPWDPSQQQPWDQQQWGQQPQSSGQQWDKPMNTMAFADALDPGEVVNHNDGGERTVALDADKGDWMAQLNGNAGQESPQSEPQDEKWDMPDGWQKSNAPAKPSTPKTPGLVIGHPMDASASEGMTRQIDIRSVQMLYGDKVNPIKEFFRTIPVRYLFILGGVLGVAIIGFIIAAVAINSEPEKNPALAEEEVDPDAPKSFAEIVSATKALSSSFYPFDGELAKSGAVVAVSPSIGIVYNEKKIADIGDLKSASGPFVEKIFNAIKNDPKGNEPIIFLFDEMLPMSSVYKIMYSMAATSRHVYFGGVMSNGISMLDIVPCNWPDHDFTVFNDCKSVTVELGIKKLELILKRIGSDMPLAIDPDGTEHTELRDDIIGDKIVTVQIAKGIARLRSGGGSTVRLSPDGDVNFGVFINAVLTLRGDAETPNVKGLYLLPVPLR